MFFLLLPFVTDRLHAKASRRETPGVLKVQPIARLLPGSRLRVCLSVRPPGWPQLPPPGRHWACAAMSQSG
ncbi:hypothetical protein ANANG_G00162170 [Anguilla anguilla]|uniref:Uncharacterized protein n=1 Tax=Anguilla anguilla TaxID=7936 RepID=A0A9D3M9J2_ANGAN|nr:hypothetical protein ANANG_G00162170 [Anguilla anguilla]